MAQQIEQIDKPEFELIDFDANVFDAILQFLPLNDLAALAQTCTKFNREIDRHFSLKRKNDGSVFIYGDDGEISFIHIQPYQEQFQSLIKNVEVKITNRTRMQNLFEFIKENCPKELRSLELDNFYRSSRMDGCETIAEQLSNVEILKLYVRPDNFLNYCVNLRMLLLSVCRVIQNYNWLNQVWPKLELFSYYESTNNSIDMSNFFRNHPHLKNVFCIQESAIRSFCSTEIDLSHITIHLIWFGNDLNTINNLQRLCNLKLVKFLDIKIGDIEPQQLDRILNLKALKSIHMFGRELGKMSSDRTYPNIEMVFIKSYEGNSFNEFQKRLKCFPNIRVLGIGARPEREEKEILFWINANIPSLQHIFMTFTLNLSFDMKKLNEERAKLQNAKTVKIHLPEYNILIKPMLWKKEFISIVSSTEIFWCPSWDGYERFKDYVSTMDSLMRDG